MLVGIISDTHGHEANTRAAVRMFQSLDVESLIHCGDIGSREIVRMLADWPTHYVLGNVDDRPEEIQEAIGQCGGFFHGRCGQVEFQSRKIVFLHGDDQRRFQRELIETSPDLLCHGHTHKAEQRLVGGVLVLNPGAVYRARPHTIATVEMATLEAHVISID